MNENELAIELKFEAHRQLLSILLSQQVEHAPDGVFQLEALLVHMQSQHIFVNDGQQIPQEAFTPVRREYELILEKAIAHRKLSDSAKASRGSSRPPT